MQTADWIILGAVALVAVQGYFRGFLLGAISLTGFVLGALAGSRFAPLVLSKGSSSPYAALISLGGAVLGGLLLAALFERFGARLRRFLMLPGLRQIDGIAGALVAGAVTLGLFWIAGAALLQSASSLKLSAAVKTDIERSRILRFLDSRLPPSGSVLHDLARVDPLPTISGPSADVAAPDAAILTTAGVTSARGSVVKILGEACGLQVEGSGFVVSSGLILTAAHVVAGEKSTEVQVTDAGGATSTLQARVVLFDPHNDIAALRVTRLSAKTLTLASGPASGTSAAILGYPEDGPYTVVAARIGKTVWSASDNAYGDPTMRLLMAVRGAVRPGNSGGPLVDGAGQVLGMIFAEVTNPPKGEAEGFAVPSSLLASAVAKANSLTTAVSTEHCAA